MPNCQYEQQISLLLDGELSGRDASLAEAHLRTCAQCAKRYEEYQNLSRLFSDTMAEPPKDFAASVMAQILAEEKEKVVPIAEGKKKKKKSAFAPLLATAAMLAVIIGVVSMAGRNVPTEASLSQNRTQIVETQQAAPAEESEPDGEALAAVLSDDLDAADVSMDTEGFAAVLGAGVPQSDDETTAEIRALLKDGTETDAPEAEPVCTLTDQEEDTLVWIDGEDVIYTEDGEHFLRIENLADTLKALLDLD